MVALDHTPHVATGLAANSAESDCHQGKLTPRGPAGRPDRKALAFTSEIARLRIEGYSCEAIRAALRDAGVEVSRSTVKREVARVAKPGGGIRPMKPLGHKSAAKLPEPFRAVPTVSGKEVAAQWMNDHITNPLVRARIAHEGGRR